MSGPTDTIDIDFTGYFPNMPDFVQGILERAGKSWSYRLKDVLGPHLLTDGVVTRLPRNDGGYPLPYYNDGILVDADTDYQNPAVSVPWRGSRADMRDHQSHGEDFMVRSGWVNFSAKGIECCGDIFARHIAAHEIGHAIGQSASPESSPDQIARYVDPERGVWTGPALTAANGGVQVSFQEQLSGGGFDFGHLGACPMINSYCGDDRIIPHELDFAYLKDIGYTVLDEYPDDPETYNYGAWADHSAWSVTVKRALLFDPFRIDDYIGVEARVMGNPSNANFSDTHGGQVTWTGSLLATDLTAFGPVFGDAEITLSADTLAGTVAFTELETVRKSNRGNGELTSWRSGRLDYPVSVTGNGFQDVDGRVVGALYGPSHEEAAGTLHDGVVKITGAFGGKAPMRSGPERFHVYDNTAGADPRDTWRPHRPIQSYFDLMASPGQPVPSRLRGKALGSRDGIHYGQDMSGPTDTIDIDFLWYGQSIPEHLLGVMERAGKAWSYRLKDVLGPHRLTDGVVTRLDRDERGHSVPYENDGLLVGSELRHYTSAYLRDHESAGDDFMARSSGLRLSDHDISCCGNVLGGQLAARMVGHALGHSASSNYTPDQIARHVDYERGVWTGPAVTEANGGVQVSFEKHHDGTFNFDRLGACPMIMSRCGDDRMTPHELDFAYMKDIGYTVSDEYPSDPEMYSYGAWAEHSAWSVTVKRVLLFDPSRIDDYIVVEPEVAGNPSEPAFSDIHGGTVTWNGSLLATDLTTFAPVFGSAEITLSADTLDGTAVFTDLETVRKTDTGQVVLTGWSPGRLDYPVSVTSNGFQDADGRVSGTLFGPAHEEAAGTLHDEVEKIAGAFGGRR